MRKLPELDQITAFLAVAEALSFRRAAERLALDQSALSRRIKAVWRQPGDGKIRELVEGLAAAARTREA